MNKLDEVKNYSLLEEKINISSHAVGFILSIFASWYLIKHAVSHGNALHIAGFSVFGASLLILYAASTAYHSAKNPLLRERLRIFDHASIYVLIAGTYTPFALITLKGSTGWLIFGISWGMALVGIVLKLFFTGRYKLISTSMYVFMGWLIIFVINPLTENLATEGLYWLIMGGLAYTVGAVIYGLKKIKFNHGIFHVFVLIGSACHFVAVFIYVLPK